eukprot:14755268-Heterocapsa_arctica.AAC.1
MFSPASEAAAFECTVPCTTGTRLVIDQEHLNASSLCRCRKGRGGNGTSCSGCPTNTYQHAATDDDYQM